MRHCGVRDPSREPLAGRWHAENSVYGAVPELPLNSLNSHELHRAILEDRSKLTAFTAVGLDLAR